MSDGILGTLAIIVSIVFFFVPAYAYSVGILAGIVSARLEHRRTTSKSPWIFFDREFEPHARTLRYCFLPWLLIGNAAFWMPHIPYALREGISSEDMLAGLWILQLSLNMTFFNGAFITHYAPRWKRPLALSAWCFVVGYFSLVFWWLGVVFASAAFGPYFGPTLISSIGPVFFVLTWRRVRRKLDRAWFRFDG